MSPQLWRPATNYKSANAGLTISIADNPSLNAADVTFNVRASNGLLATWSGPVPTITGPGLVARIPLIGGSSVSWQLSVATSRMEVLPVGLTTFRLERSPGGGAFIPTTVVTLSHTNSDYEKISSSLSSITVSSGDLLRIVFVAVAGSGGAYEVELQGVPL